MWVLSGFGFVRDFLRFGRIYGFLADLDFSELVKFRKPPSRTRYLEIEIDRKSFSQTALWEAISLLVGVPRWMPDFTVGGQSIVGARVHGSFTERDRPFPGQFVSQLVFSSRAVNVFHRWCGGRRRQTRLCLRYLVGTLGNRQQRLASLHLPKKVRLRVVVRA